jgi:hypothetical protein
MKVTENREVRETRTTVKEIRCDMCPAVTKRELCWPGRGDNNVNRTKIEFEYGSSYPEGQWTTTQSFDVCPDCWEGKVVPWFMSQGAMFRQEESKD